MAEQKKILTLRLDNQLYKMVVNSSELSGKTITRELTDRIRESFNQDTDNKSLSESEVKKLIQQEILNIKNGLSPISKL